VSVREGRDCNFVCGRRREVGCVSRDNGDMEVNSGVDVDVKVRVLC
jgi:hypothetical protein